MRQWLEDYENGKSEASIAKDAHLDIKTVKAGISRAIQERRINIVQTEQLRKALGNHQDQLLGAIANIKSALKVPEISVKPALTLTLDEVAVIYSPEKGPAVVLTVENTLIWELLQEHLRRDKLWKLLIDWKAKLLAHLQAKVALRKKIDELLPKLGYKLAKDGGKTDPNSFIYSRRTGDLLYLIILYGALGMKGVHEMANNIIVEEGGAVRWEGSKLAETVGKAKEFKAKILDLINNPDAGEEIGRVKTTYEELVIITKKTKDEAEEKSMLGMITGHCRICHKLGI